MRGGSRLAVPRLLATGSVVSATTSLRVSASWAALLARRTPSLVRLGLLGTAGGHAETSRAAFRDELIALARESAEVSWRQMRRGVDDLDALTGGAGRARPSRVRPYRIKP
jgi:hypothetical protein